MNKKVILFFLIIMNVSCFATGKSRVSSCARQLHITQARKKWEQMQLFRLCKKQYSARSSSPWGGFYSPNDKGTICTPKKVENMRSDRGIAGTLSCIVGSSFSPNDLGPDQKKVAFGRCVSKKRDVPMINPEGPWTSYENASKKVCTRWGGWVISVS